MIARTHRLPELLALLGGAPISYRQLDYWQRRFPHLVSAPPNPGSGYHRAYTAGDIANLRRMAWCVAAGFQPAAAAQLAIAGGYHRLSPHVVVRVSP